MVADIGIDDPFYNDRPMILVVYIKYWKLKAATLAWFLPVELTKTYLYFMYTS